MNVRQRRAVTDQRIMSIAKEQVAVIFAMATEEQPTAWTHAIEAAKRFDDIEVSRGCVRVYESIVAQAETFK